MKHLITVVVSLNFLLIQAQQMPIDKETGKITYTEVVKADSATKKELYSALKLWVANAFVSSKDVTQLTDDESNTIVVKALTEVILNGHSAGYVHFTLTIQCKDGRYKYDITDFRHKRTSEMAAAGGCDGDALDNTEYVCPSLFTLCGMGKKKAWVAIKTQTDANIQALIANMKSGIAKGITTKKADW